MALAFPHFYLLDHRPIRSQFLDGLDRHQTCQSWDLSMPTYANHEILNIIWTYANHALSECHKLRSKRYRFFFVTNWIWDDLGAKDILCSSQEVERQARQLWVPGGCLRCDWMCVGGWKSMCSNTTSTSLISTLDTCIYNIIYRHEWTLTN